MTRLPLSGFTRVSLAVSSAIFVMALPARASGHETRPPQSRFIRDAQTLRQLPGRAAVESQISATFASTDAAAAAEGQTTNGQINGVVLDENGQPIPSQRVELRRPERDGAGRLVATTDVDGRFAYAGLLSGRYEVELRIDGRVVATSGPIELSAEEPTVRTVTLARPAPPPIFPPERNQISTDRLLGGGPALTSFEALSSLLERGHEVVVTDEAGRSMKGRISSISPRGLVLARKRFRFSRPQERVFASELVRTVQFVDSAWNGALIGAAVSLGVVAVMTESDCSRSCVDNFGRPGRWVLGSTMMVPLGIGIGRLLDSAINKSVYEQPGRREVAISPLLGRDILGVKARVRF